AFWNSGEKTWLRAGNTPQFSRTRGCRTQNRLRSPLATKEKAMKTAVYCSVFTLVSLWSLVTFGQACHNNGGGGGGYNNGGYPNGQPYPGQPYPETDPYATGAAYSTPVPNANLVPAANITTAQLAAAAPVVAANPAPVGPTARITVLAANASLAS